MTTEVIAHQFDQRLPGETQVDPSNKSVNLTTNNNNLSNDVKIINPVNTKTVRHGEWTFEYNSKSNIYDSLDIESYYSKRFDHCVQQSANDTVKTYDQTTDTKDGTKLTEKDLEDFRKAALIHKIARKKALTMLYAGAKLADLVDAVESVILRLCRQDLKTYYAKGSPADNHAGIAFPVGVNINNVVAHEGFCFQCY